MIRRKKLGMAIKKVCDFSKEGLSWVRSDKELPSADLYIRWGCTATVPCSKVLNKASAIHTVNNKSGFRALLKEKEASLIPFTFFNISDAVYPAVIRPKQHAQGKKLYLVNTEIELIHAINKCGDGWYGAEYIKKVKEYRVFVLQGRALWVADKTPADPTAVAWNVAKGGKFSNVRWGDWPLRVVKIALKATKHSGLDFGGVDVMVDKDGIPYIIEINSAPSQTSPYRQECTAKGFDYIIKHENKEQIPLIPELGGYLKFIHPSLTDKAKLVQEG